MIALHYQLQRGIVVLNTSLKEERIKENMQVMSEIVSFQIVHTNSP